MTTLRRAERWFHAVVLRHPQYTAPPFYAGPLTITCHCGVEWRMG